MKQLISLCIGLISLSFSNDLSASLEIHCPNDKEITYAQYLAGNYWNPPVVYGPHTLYGPWIYSHLNCGSGYVDIKWEIVDHYARSYYCTQTIWVNNSYSHSNISVWCPKEQTVYCDELEWIQYVKPEVTGGNYWIYGPTVSKSLNDCGVGSIWVEWKVVDACGKKYYCKSVIWVKPRSGYAKIYWPKDFEADLCTDYIDPKYLPWPYGYPDIYQKNPCAKYGFSYKDEEYTFPNDTGICKKIVRRWSVIDWCTYNLNGYGYQSYGKWEHSQIIKIVSKKKPTISCVPEVKVGQEIYAKSAWVDIPIPTFTSTCNGQSKLTHNSIYSTKPSPDASGIYPIGTTYVIFKVKDPCGNFAVCTTKVIVLDKTAPTPYCIGSLVTGIAWHKDGLYTVIDPKKFDVGSYDNLTPKDKLTFVAEPKVFNCDSLGTRKIKIWVIDEAGNKDYCVVTLVLQDNQGMCPKPPVPPVVVGDTMFIAGILLNSDDLPLDSVSLALSFNQVTQTMIGNGHYATGNLNSGIDYKITPSKRGAFMDGITVEDYTLLIDHLQGKDTLEDPYQLLAADIDLNDTIDMDDAFLLGYYILTHANTLSDSAISWRFIPSDYDLSLIDPLSNTLKKVPGFLEYKNLDTTIYTADFIGIKIGDIDQGGLYESLTNKTDYGLKSNLSLKSTGKSGSKMDRFHPKLEKASMVRNEDKQLTFLSLYPNPFQQNTTLQFLSSGSEQALLQIYDMNGKQVYTQSKQLNKGLNEIKIEGSKLMQHGIYIYHLQTQNFIHNGKISFLD